MPVATLPKPFITIDGNLSDWIASERIDYGDVRGLQPLCPRAGRLSRFRAQRPGGDRPQHHGLVQHRPECHHRLSDLRLRRRRRVQPQHQEPTAPPRSTPARPARPSCSTTSSSPTPPITSRSSSPYPRPRSAIPVPSISLYDVNDSAFGPADYTQQPYVAYADNGVTRTDPTHRIGIVYSDTTAANYFSATAYSDLFMAAQNQAMQAGIPFDLLNEADLTDLAKLANYDALVFPSFTNVQSGDVAAITNTLLQATKQFGIGLITSGDFMTNDQTGARPRRRPLRQHEDLLRRDPAHRRQRATSRSTPATRPDRVHQRGARRADPSYTGSAGPPIPDVSGTGQTIATETVGGQAQPYAAALATQTTGGKNVLFSTAGVMADSNLLGQAIDYVAQPVDPVAILGISLSLDMTRSNGIVAARMDMDQSQFPADVSPVETERCPASMTS